MYQPHIYHLLSPPFERVRVEDKSSRFYYVKCLLNIREREREIKKEKKRETEKERGGCIYIQVGV